MNTVQPIRDTRMVLNIASYLKNQSERNYIMFMIGIYSGLRISDILKLQVRDVRDKRYISIREQKTGKEKRFQINKELKKALDHYIKEKKDYEYLIQSRNGSNQPISRVQAYRILKAAGDEFLLDDIGTHTLRKTFGYHMYQQNHDAVILKEIFNHSSLETTMRYIGIIQDNKDSAVGDLTYKL